jgi:hypothetical protein
VNDSEHPTQAPPAGEQLHLPGPSIKPFLTAIAITLGVIGTRINIILSIVGLIALVIIVVMWVGDTRRDIAELPEEHGH